MTPSAPKLKRVRVGELRPSHLLLSFGVGSIVDLPNVSVMVMGIDDWPLSQPALITEERLLKAVRKELGNQVERLLAPPPAPDIPPGTFPDDDAYTVGVPVAPFPRWLVCPFCKLLAPIGPLFELKTNMFRPEKTRYIHKVCRTTKAPPAIPVRFLVACEHGHLNDFPWVEFVHKGPTACKYELQFVEEGMGGEAADVQVRCRTCESKRSLAEAYGDLGKKNLPMCRGRRPQLRDFDPKECDQQVRPILLGASNSWFPLLLSALTIPRESNKLKQLVEDNWAVLSNCADLGYVKAFRAIGKLGLFGQFTDTQIWAAIEAKRSGGQEETDADLKSPEYSVFSNPAGAPTTPNFRVRQVDTPKGYEPYFERVVLAELLREVRALIGFTRIESPNEFGEAEGLPDDRRGPISRSAPKWVPANEIRGEGLFIQFRESEVQKWAERVRVLEEQFFESHKGWRSLRKLDPNQGFPRARYILLHSFAHALIRQFAIECGYSAASLRERVYAREPNHEDGPMAGVLIYTAAPDSEGTLGGLVALGEPAVLGRHLDQALDAMRLCASDPLCAEHAPAREGLALHAAACHACLFASETSCERGNKYLDRSVLVPTVERSNYAFFKVND